MHSKRLPLLRTGRMVFANCFSSGSPPSTRICEAKHPRSIADHEAPDHDCSGCNGILGSATLAATLTLRPTLSKDNRPIVRPAKSPEKGTNKKLRRIVAQTGRADNGTSPWICMQEIMITSWSQIRPSQPRSLKGEKLLV